MPATVNLVADRLGISHVPTYQIQSGCAGAIQGIDTACRILRDDSEEDDGEARGIGLVIGGDVCAKHMNLNRDFSAVPPGELVNYLLFADGAGAAVVSRRPLRRNIAIRRVLNRFVGLGQPPGQTIAWYGSAGWDSGEPAAQEDYSAIKEHVPRLAEEIVYELADSLDWDVDALDFLLPPQLSGRMTRLITERIGGRAKEISCVTETGNNGNALPFLQLHQLTRVMGAGDRALSAAVESSKWIKGGLALEMADS
jgi:3-oxoacyl-[acyl-carrier-protein] synthase-3